MGTKYIRVEMKIQVGNEMRHCELSGDYPDSLVSPDFVTGQVYDVSRSMAMHVATVHSIRKGNAK